MSEKLVLRKFLAPEVVFGMGARKLAGEYAYKYGLKKVMIVSDKGVMAAGWVDEVIKELNYEQIEYILFSNVTPNPRDYEVMEGAELYRKNHCDGIIAIGGGSPMDLAKGVGIVVTNGGIIDNYQGVDKIRKPVPPLIFIPTTAGTSADVSQFSIITDTKNQIKIAIVSKNIVPDIALIDFETTLTMDKYLTACTGIDALIHGIEAYVSKASSPITDIHALEAIRIIYKTLPLVLSNPDNLEYREKMMFASMEAGFAFSNAILGAVHAMAHSLGGLLDLPHGECNGLLLDSVVEYNYDSIPQKYDTILECFEEKKYKSADKKIILIDKIKEFKENIGIVKRLKNCGVKNENIPMLSEKAIHDACMITNPKNATKEEIAEVYAKAM